MTYILRTEKRTYHPTAADVLWLHRAVEGEGPPHREVAAVLVNGFMWARECSGFSGPLMQWIRAYAQPVNPRWYVDGDLFRKQWTIATGDKRKGLEIVARAREATHSTRVRFSQTTADAVHRALTEPISAARCDWTDYAAARIDASKKGYIPRTPKTPGVNRFWTRPSAIGWQGYFTAAAGGSGPPMAVSVLLCGFALWAILRA